MKYTTGEIAEITGSQIFGNPHLVVKHIAYDSRKIFSAHKTAFIAINTPKNSGEKYIASAVEKRISIIISEHKLEIDGVECWIIVDNVFAFLRRLARHLLENSEIKTIGITGSNGKTIVKEWLFQSLNDDFSVVKSPKSFNSQLGLPLSILETREENNLGIFEVGISMPDEMEIQESALSPKIGVLTNIGSAHSANFTNTEILIDEKIKLFKNSDVIIFNGDNHLVFSKINSTYSDKKLISFGFNSRNTIRIKNDWQNRNEDIQIAYGEEEIWLPVNQRDSATISNALAVIGVLKELNFDNDKIVEKLNNLKAVEMRLESVEGIRNNLIINDSFNLDIDSLIIAFQFIKEYNKQHKTLILTDFLEGKDSSETFYRNVADITNQQGFDMVLLIGKEITQFQRFFDCETYTFEKTDDLVKSHIINKIEDSLILLKGARKFEIEKLKNLLELQKHDTVLEVNLNAILHNINVHKALLKPETKMMAMVKAYSYGLGGYEIAEFLQHHHIDYLGVAYADEGVNLRRNGISTPIMVMNPEQHSYGSIIEYNLEPEIYSFRVLELFCEQLHQKGFDGKYPIHIKLETGMHRLGFKPNEIQELIEKLNANQVKVASIFSHLSVSDIPEEREYTLQQIQAFELMSTELISGLGYQPIRHILNSSGITNYSEYQYDMVRIGIGMVGISSNPDIKKQLQSAVSFKTVVSQISEIKKGETVGYSRRFIAEEDTKIATIPVGYADGVPRLLGNSVGYVGINGQLIPIVGNVCMDMIMLDIKNYNIKEGDEVIIFNGNPSLEEFSLYCNTIPYEVLTSINRRVKRVYIKN